MALIPWVMFAVTAVLTGIGAVSPAACAIIGPIALGFAGRYGISPLMMGMFVVHGAQAGGFSPISIYGVITNSVMEDAGLPSSEITIFLASLVVNTIMAAILFVVLGGRKLMAMRIDPDEPGHPRRGPAPRRRHRARPAARAPPPPTGTQAQGVRRDQVLTLLAFVGVAARRAGLRQEHRLRRDHRRGHPGDAQRQRAQGRGQADRLADRPAGRRRQHLRHDPDHRRARRSSSATGPPASARPRSAR